MSRRKIVICFDDGPDGHNRPGPLFVLFRQERLVKIGMTTINVRDYDVALPPKAADDVFERVLTVSDTGHAEIPGSFVISAPLGQAGPPSQRITVLEGLVNVTIELRDRDNAGKLGDPSQFTFDATDNTPPPAPGALGVTEAGERLMEVSDPAPVPADEGGNPIA